MKTPHELKTIFAALSSADPASHSASEGAVLSVLQRLDFEQFCTLLNTGELPPVRTSPQELEALRGGWRIALAGYEIKGGKHTVGSAIEGGRVPNYGLNDMIGFET